MYEKDKVILCVYICKIQYNTFYQKQNAVCLICYADKQCYKHIQMNKNWKEIHLMIK